MDPCRPDSRAVAGGGNSELEDAGAAEPVPETQLDCEISGDKIKGLFVIYVIGTGGLLRGWLLGQGTTYDVFLLPVAINYPLNIFYGRFCISATALFD